MEDNVIQDPGKLTSLPFEILSRILTNVDNSDITTLKLTCKTIFSAMMTRQFWYNRIDRLCKEHLVCPPEEELEEYTITELEQWTLRRIPIRSGVPTKFNIRSHGHSQVLDGLRHFRTIPGGRWLLAVYKRFTVYCFDLDSSDLRRYLLLDLRDVNPSICEGSREIIGDHVWIDHESPRLSFRFAASVTHFEEGPRFFWVYIYQVDLIGHGASGTLVARIIATFQSPEKTGSYSSCTLNRRYFIQSRIDSQGRGMKLELFDYRQALGCFDHPRLECHTFSVDCYLKNMEFINKDMFGIQCSDEAFYRTFNIESPTSTRLLHKVRGKCFDSSPTLWTPEASLMTWTGLPNHFMLKADQTIAFQGLVIPHDGRPPWTVELGKRMLMGRRTSILGIFFSISHDHDTGVISYVNHKWDYTLWTNSDRVPTLSTMEYSKGLPEGLFAFFEDAGRLLYFGQGLHVFDIILAK